MKGIIVASIPKIRDYVAMSACLRSGGFMKDRRAPRGGARNLHQEYLGEAMEELVCDFCGKPSDKIRRIAIAEGYDRLHTARPPLWACPPCSVKKEQTRLGSPSVEVSDGL